MGAQAGGPVSLGVPADDPAAAARLAGGLAPAAPALVLLFGSPRPVLPPVARALSRALPGVRIAGCSSAGEIGPFGYQRGTIVAVGFPRAAFRAEAIALPDQGGIPVSGWLTALRGLRARFPDRAGRSLFGVLLADGTACNEDVLAAALDAALPGIAVVGGSAGDGLDFGESVQILDGAPVRGAAVFVMVETALAVAEVSFAHFTPTARRAVVTRADPAGREIIELNAAPAAEEYARLAGLEAARMERADFARFPLLLRTGRRHHVRAISGVGPGGTLRLMSAVERGEVLTLGRAGDVTQGFADALEALPRPPLMVLGFDCILRRLAVERAGMTHRMAELFARYRVAGFNTYGEQHSGMHVNQTFVGLALMPAGAGP
ncbi:FIST N-terminal domain-containing protein [Paracoccus contaminans]|uniref:GfdT n=1 Tax=Paracoccus contaminans TaxID=1945662 RepID=A0A1W6CWA1_9RHOB|nr:FIST N-terminal domain-containing protein [Paracoccus contaminans]ARJ69049.1 GfdT [Paracoccus contaminans]